MQSCKSNISTQLTDFKNAEVGSKSPIHWDEETSTPYVVIQKIIRGCHMGYDRNKAYNAKRHVVPAQVRFMR